MIESSVIIHIATWVTPFFLCSSVCADSLLTSNCKLYKADWKLKIDQQMLVMIVDSQDTIAEN